MEHLEHGVDYLLRRARPVRNDHLENRRLTQARTSRVARVDNSIGEEDEQVLLLLPRHRFSFRSHIGKAERRGVGLETSQGSIGRDHESVRDRKSTRLNSSHLVISYAVFCVQKKNRT